MVDLRMAASFSTISFFPTAMDDVTSIGMKGGDLDTTVTMTTVFGAGLANSTFPTNQTEDNSTLSSFRYSNTAARRILQVIALAILDILCFSGNLLLILTIHRCRELRNVSNILIINLAAIGILLSLTVLPTWAATAWSQALHFSGTICELSAMLMFLFFLEAILTLGGVAVDRYGNICHPFRYPMLISNWKILVFIGVTWVMSIGLSVLPLVGFGRYAYGISEVSICTIDFSHDTYFSLLTVFLVIVPTCITICFCYWKIFAVARDQARKVRNLETSIAQNTQQTKNNAANGSGPSKLSVPVSHFPPTLALPPPPPNPPPRPRHKLWQIAARTVKNSVRQSRAFRTVFTIIGCFLVCWTPYIVLIFYAITSNSKPGHDLEFVITYLALANYVANPIICVTMNKEFRKGVRKLFGLHRKRLLQDVISAWTSTALQMARNASRQGSRRGSKVRSRSGSRVGSRRGSQASQMEAGGVPLPGNDSYINNVD